MTEAAKATGTVRTYLAQAVELTALHDALLALLTPPEQVRAARYLRSSSREEFIIGRACLRLLLAQHLQTAPQAVVLTEGQHGKLESAGIEFNLSHSHGLIAIAVADVPVGVDVEWADRDVEVLEVAAAALQPAEVAELTALTDIATRRARFFAMWTAHEARSKCLGVGLAGLVAAGTSTANLHVHPLALPPGYYGAVCAEVPVEPAAPAYLTEKTIGNLMQRR